MPNSQSIKNNKHLKIFGDLLHNPHLWHMNRHSVAKAFAVGLGKQIELNIPRDRLGLFQPMVLALIRDQQQQLEDLSFELLYQWVNYLSNR